MLNGHPMADELVNGIDNADESGALDQWAAEDAAAPEEDVEDEAWDLADEDDKFFDPEAQDDEVIATDASRGLDEVELWKRNSPFAADHIAAGAFESAMQLLNRQVGVVNFEPLKSLFLSIYQSSHVYLTPTPSMPSLHLHLRRNIEESKPTRVMPLVYQSLARVRADLQEAYVAVNKNQLGSAKTILEVALRSMLLVAVSTDAEANEWRDLITEAREYLIGVSIELQRRTLEQEEPDNVQRSLELAHYFAHCQMQPRHLQLALRNAMLINKKANNHASAAQYARRLLELNPETSVAQKARAMVTAGERNPRNALEIPVNQHTEFDICAATYTPIYRGSASVTCPFTGASYLPKFKGKLDPLLGMTELGAPGAGLPAPL